MLKMRGSESVEEFGVNISVASPTINSDVSTKALRLGPLGAAIW